MWKLKYIILTFLWLVSIKNIAAQDLLYRIPDEKQFEKYYDYIKAFAPNDDAFVALQRLAGIYVKKKEWEIAKSLYMELKSYFPNDHKRIDKIIKLLEQDLGAHEAVNISQYVNTQASEYSPIPMANMKSLYFTSNKRNNDNKSEDIFYSEHQDGQWMPAKKLAGSINSKRNEAAQCISVDGNTLVVFGNYSDSYGRGDLYYSDLDSNSWGPLKHFPSPINSKFLDCDAYLSSDGNALIFASERPGGVGGVHYVNSKFHGSFYGNTDIYVCTKQDTAWSEPINLGTIINTPFAERKPHLHHDGKTLYFSSEGHYGLGRLDVFMSKRLNDSLWTEWSEPVNLGKQINGAGHDWGLRVIAKGDEAFFSANNRKINKGKSDLYSITIPVFARPEPVVAVEGKVLDAQGKPIEAEIIWEDLETGRVTGKIKSNAVDGSYFFILPTGKIYGYYAKKDGYYPVSKNIDLSDQSKYIKVNEDFTMFNVSDLLDGSVRINNLFFEYDKAVIKPESYPELNRLVNMLQGISNVSIEIAGHTDHMGSEEYNIELSERRAQAVVDYLVKNGVDQIDFQVKGYGKTKPVATNTNENGRALNRRVELTVIK